jgi:hypothetical protein
MTSKNILRAFIVEEPSEGSDRKPFFHRVGTVFPHQNGSGFNLVIPPGISVSGRIVCLAAEGDESASQNE